jgi:mRNA-degrading endonuclease HigB of HigAB toxin-antitoxin module
MLSQYIIITYFYRTKLLLEYFETKNATFRKNSISSNAIRFIHILLKWIVHNFDTNMYKLISYVKFNIRILQVSYKPVKPNELQ